MRPLIALLLALVVSGCSVPRKIDEVKDEELRSKHQWTAADERARALLEAEPPPAYGTAPDPERPIRNPSVVRKFVTLYQVGGTEIPIPSPTRAVEWLLGFRWDPKYYYLSGSRTYILLRRDAPPVIVDEGGSGDPAPAPRWRDQVPSMTLRAAEQLGPPIELPRPEPRPSADRGAAP